MSYGSSLTQQRTALRTEYDGGNVQDVLDTVKPMQSYSALRNYTGRSTSVRITTPQIAGFFNIDLTDVASADNGGTIIVDAAGRRWKRLYFGDINIKWFGAAGDGVTDDAPAFQKAINYAQNLAPKVERIILPSADYLIGSTLNVSNNVVLWGDGFNTSGARIFHKTSLNAPMFSVTAGMRFLYLSIIGSNNAANTSECCVNINGGNNVTFDNVTFYNAYDGIYINGASPAFYISLQDCRFENCNSSFIKLDNSSSAGVDLMMSNVRFLGNMPASAWKFINGLGSIIANNVQMSVTGAGPAAHLVYFGTRAPNFGGAQFTNCVFESGGASVNSTAFYTAGTNLLPWKQMQFDNCFFSANAGPAFVFTWANGFKFVDCEFSSGNATGGIWFSAGTTMNGIKMVACRHESAGAAPPMVALGNSVIELDCYTPHWTGAAPIIDFSPVIATQLKLGIHGGNLGTAVNPILLNDAPNSLAQISSFNYNFGPLRKLVLTGILDASGNVVRAHGITAAQTFGAVVQGFYKGATAEMKPLAMSYMDGTNVSFTGGTNSAKYRIIVLYNSTADSNW